MEINDGNMKLSKQKKISTIIFEVSFFLDNPVHSTIVINAKTFEIKIYSSTLYKLDIVWSTPPHSPFMIKKVRKLH